MKDLTDFIERIFNLNEPWNSWRGFWKTSLYLIIAILAFDIATANFFSKIFLFSATQRPIIFIASFTPFFIYSIFFFINRLHKVKISLSGKYNVVFAYNTEGLNTEKFSKLYDKLMVDIRNEIIFLGFGDKIKIIVCPPDIKLKNNTAAEAQTKLGLDGSTILVWGYITKRTGTYCFSTQFSYEFGLPPKIDNETKVEIKNNFSNFIQKIITRGLFLDKKVNLDNFTEQILPTIFFIFTITNHTLKQIKNSEFFALAFKKSYGRTGIMRKKDLGPAFIEINDIQILIGHKKLKDVTKKYTLKTKEYDLNEIHTLATNILTINNKDYASHVALSYYYEHKNERDKALDHHELATQYARRGEHAHLFNKAYFALLRDGYKNAIDIYLSIPNSTTVETTEVSQDLNRKYQQTKSLKFLFADAYVTFRWDDEICGKRLFSEFISLAKDKPDYSLMLKIAKSL